MLEGGGAGKREVVGRPGRRDGRGKEKMDGGVTRWRYSDGVTRGEVVNQGKVEEENRRLRSK